MGPTRLFELGTVVVQQSEVPTADLEQFLGARCKLVCAARHVSVGPRHLVMLGDDHRTVVREETLAYGLGRIRDVRQGPDGYIYFAIDDRTNAGPTAIMRIEPAD